ncbi:MAG TPA: DUF1996 domain-containing protein [Pseudonocardia sp.]|nr:DUF1996 domain-containing protein [Pseudonocardia sp.]
MDRPVRHRLPRPNRLLALVVTLLVGCGVVLAAGTAAASGEDETALAAADRTDGSGDGRGGDGRGNARGKGEGRGDPRDPDARDNGRDGLRDGTRDNGRADGRGGDPGDPRDRNGRDLRDVNGRNDNNRNNRNDQNNRNDNNRNNNNRNGQNNQNNQNNKDDEEFPGRDQAAPPSDDDFVDINDVRPDNDRPRHDGDASTGSFVARCGLPDGHRNSDNFMVTPGKRNGAQHVHNYVGNLSTDADSTDDSLHAAGTSCDRDNKSTFFWPVLRDTGQQGDDADEDGGGLDGNVGKILQERTVDLRFLGNATSKVEPMPDDLTIIMGDAKAKTNGPTNANAQWTCTGFENRTTDKYPLCPAGSRLVRILEFPSCWDGENLDSEDHRSHVAFPDDDGRCQDGFKTIPRLRETITYDRPNGRDFALDTFPDQQHDPSTDHSDFMNIAPDALGKLAADCINSGRNC